MCNWYVLRIQINKYKFVKPFILPVDTRKHTRAPTGVLCRSLHPIDRENKLCGRIWYITLSYLLYIYTYLYISYLVSYTAE